MYSVVVLSSTLKLYYNHGKKIISYVALTVEKKIISIYTFAFVPSRNVVFALRYALEPNTSLGDQLRTG